MRNSGTTLCYTLTLASGMLECLCFAGVIFGYATLVFVLKEDGYFSHLCSSVPDGNSTLNSTGEFRSDNIGEGRRTLLKKCNASPKEKKNYKLQPRPQKSEAQPCYQADPLLACKGHRELVHTLYRLYVMLFFYAKVFSKHAKS